MGIQSRTWGNVATSCEMWESELFLFFFVELPWSSYRKLRRLHMLVFLLMLPLIAKHPPLISFVFHSFWVESISCLHLISLRFSLFLLSIWLSLVHFLLRLPAPDPVGSASAGSRQVEIRGGGVEPLMRYQWQVSWDQRTVFLFSFFLFCWRYIDFWSMQILDGDFS